MNLTSLGCRPRGIVPREPIAAAVARLSPPRLLAACALSLATLLASGCNDETPIPTTTSVTVGRDEQAQAQDSLDRATDFLQRLDEFEPSQIEGQITYHLNAWIGDVSPNDAWQPDPLIDDLPKELRDHSALKIVAGPKFQVDDMTALKEALWMRQISDWVLHHDTQPELVVWNASESRGDRNQRSLREAERLFDWTIRNVQLDPLLAEPTGPAAGPTAGSPGGRPDVSPARQAIPGPGYAFEPWQTILYGRGDAWQRARVFIALARQQGMDAVMLALPKSPGTRRVQPWLPALLIDDQLYLFDAELGLPIPGPQGKGVATLQDARSNPEVLKSLAVGANFPYRISAGDLKEVVALIDAAPESLSRRMATLEPRLTGKNQLVLTVKPSELAARLRQVDGIHRVALWTVPFECDMFRAAVQRNLARDERYLAAYMQQFGLFEGLHPLVQGRQRYFRGEFDNQDERLGAKGMYMECRLPDEAIRDIATNRSAQRRVGLDPSQVRPELWAARVQVAQIIAMQSKSNATYWMGFVHYATGNYKVAADWFSRSAEANQSEGPWQGGADYNLGRSYEALGRWEDARRLYLRSESPQQHGNLLRARLIAQQKAGR